MNANLTAFLYLVSGVLFILALRGLSNPETSRRGNLMGMISLRDLLEIDDDTQRKRASFLRELVTYSPDYES